MPESLVAALGRKTYAFSDRDGVEHKAPPYTLSDLADLEEAHGPMSGWGQALYHDGKSVRFRAAISFLWHSLRKEGLSDGDVNAAKWRWTREQVGDMFLGGDLAKAGDLLQGIMALSGLTVDRGGDAGRPTPEAAPTGGSSSPSPAPAA